MDLNQIRKLDDAVNPTLSLFQPHVKIEQQGDIIGVFTVRFLSSGYQDFPALATHATHKSAASIVCVANPEKSCRFSKRRIFQKMRPGKQFALKQAALIDYMKNTLAQT